MIIPVIRDRSMELPANVLRKAGTELAVKALGITVLMTTHHLLLLI